MRIHFSAGPLRERFRDRLASTERERIADRLRARDASLWKSDPSSADSIRGRLGWVDSFDAMEREAGGLVRFASEARRDFDRVLLLGMGGSSLAPELFARTFGVAGGGLPLRVLDSTDPLAVASAAHAAEQDRTLFLVASKSGTTIEIDAFRRFFASRVKDPAAFAAITDAGSPLEERAVREGYRAVFRNPSDIGGRYSALSLFGLVPAALLGVDIARVLDGGRRAARGEENPGISLGAFLAEGAAAGRDKQTLLVSRRLPGFGAWVEQLVAESTGKEGKGILPVDEEPIGPPEEYAADRLFVAIACGERDGEVEDQAAIFERAGHPVARIGIEDPLEIGAAFYLWETATAVASAILGVNAFDEPNVKESKDRTGELLARYAETGLLDEGEPRFEDDEVRIFGDRGLAAPNPSHGKEWVRAHLARARPGEYAAFLSFLPPSDPIAAAVAACRASVRRTARVATSAGFGPRFLHSTGQFFKGGPDRGVFFQITADDGDDIPVPGRSYSFGVLKRAQAIGDFGALERRGRRVLRVHGKGDPEEGVRRLAEWLG